MAARSAAIQDVCKLLAAPRSAVNITTASGKGKVVGALQIHVPEVGKWTECASSPFCIPGDINTIKCDFILNADTWHSSKGENVKWDKRQRRGGNKT